VSSAKGSGEASKKTLILVVEDNPTTRKMVRATLESGGHRVIEAPDGRTALDEVTRQIPELILQDLLLPDFDGIELIARLRAALGGAPVPILAFSGFLSKADEARTSGAGFTDILMKPIEPSRLLEAVLAHLPQALAEPESVFLGKRILVVDDDPVQLKLARVHLATHGFSVTHASDGEDALEKARASLPEAILSDVLMPRLDGFGLCRALRDDSRFAAVPIVLVSSNYLDEADRKLAEEVGASAFVIRTPGLKEAIAALKISFRSPIRRSAKPAKPVDAEHLHRVIRQLERQVGINANLSQRASLQTTELSILSGISDALARHKDIDLALDEVLSSCLDAGGISLGALFVYDREQRLSARAYGYAAGANGRLQSFFGQPQLLRDIIAGGLPVALPSSLVSEAVTRDLFSIGQINSALLIPMLAHGEPLGALLLGSGQKTLSEGDWPIFARTIGNQICQALALARAFDEKARSEKKALEQAAILESVIESIADGVIVADEHGEIILANAAANTLFPRASGDQPPQAWIQAYGICLPDQVTPYGAEDLPLVRAMRGHAVDNAQMFVSSHEGHDGIFLNVNARPLKGGKGGVSVFRDVTLERLGQAQLMVSERMASVGILAAGVAHEINNPLAAVMANLSFAQTKLQQIDNPGARESEIEEALRDASECAERVRYIVRDLKLFSRAGDERRSAVDIREVLESTLRMAFNEIRHRARLVKDYGEVPKVEANEARLGQVFLNLVVNAAQAITEGAAEKNEIRILTRVEPQTGRVVIEVRDSGAGIPPEVIGKIFDPFFTTKPVGLGTGLGLPICHRIISALGGEINVESVVGKGSIFRVLLPPAGVATSVAAPPTAAPVQPARARSRILVVDDEPLIAKAVSRTLGAEHDVVTLLSAGDALQRIVAGERFDVILCDLMMPQVTGMDMFHELQKLAPEQAARMVFLTGGAFTATARTFLETIPNPRMEKPFSPHSLIRLINDLLA
jgi:CheY-like chemotaxis protein